MQVYFSLLYFSKFPFFKKIKTLLTQTNINILILAARESIVNNIPKPQYNIDSYYKVKLILIFTIIHSMFYYYPV